MLSATGPEQVERTVAFAKMLEAAGVAALAVHGRRREQRMHQGTVDYDSIAAVKAALSIPVIANGNVRSKADADAVLASTGVDCVMSATALLANPRLFSCMHAPEAPGGGCMHAEPQQPSLLIRQPALQPKGPTLEERAQMALEYLECCKAYPSGALPRMISDHLREILRPDLNLPFNVEERNEIEAHRKTTLPIQFASLVRRVHAHGREHARRQREQARGSISARGSGGDQGGDRGSISARGSGGDQGGDRSRPETVRVTEIV